MMLLLLTLMLVLSPAVNGFHSHQRRIRYNKLNMVTIEDILIPVVASGFIVGVNYQLTTNMQRETNIKLDKNTLKLDENTLKLDENTLKLDATNSKVDLIKVNAEATSTNVKNILVAFGLFVAILGGSKTVFESIEYIPTIPSKIKQIIEDNEAKDYKGKIKELEEQLKNKK
jgi:hypothetical protein